MRVLALDYGRARCGCAVSDPTGVLAIPDRTGPRADRRGGGWRACARSCASSRCERVVVGLPVSLSGRTRPRPAETREFAARLEQELPVPVELYDERFTTRLAERTRRSGRRGLAGGRAPARGLAGQPARREEGARGVAEGLGFESGPREEAGSRLADGYERYPPRGRTRRQRYRSTGEDRRPRDRRASAASPAAADPPRRKHSWASASSPCSRWCSPPP